MKQEQEEKSAALKVIKRPRAGLFNFRLVVRNLPFKASLQTEIICLLARTLDNERANQRTLWQIRYNQKYRAAKMQRSALSVFVRGLRVYSVRQPRSGA